MSGAAESVDIKFDVSPNGEALARRVADWLIEILHAKEGLLAVSLSGGTTPKRLYGLLAAPPYLEAFPWSRVHWFWGDERFVPADDPLSNYRMVRETMMSRTPIPATNIHPIVTEGLSLTESAAGYEREIKSIYGHDKIDPSQAIFEVTLLGLGPDGHTASLFPRSAALQERNRWVAAVSDSQMGPRITLTYPTLNSSQHVAFLIEGNEKREILERFKQRDRTLPATRIHPSGSLWVFTDKAALPENAA